MGLDIYGKNDYFRFNWTGCREFEQWCVNKGLPTPFPNWGGQNDGDKIKLTKRSDRQKVKSFITAFEKMFPKETSMGIGETMREIQYVTWDSAQQDPFYKKEYSDWKKWEGVSWYHFLKNQYQIKGVISFN